MKNKMTNGMNVFEAVGRQRRHSGLWTVGLALLVLTSLGAGLARAANITNLISGNWSATGTWRGGVVPGQADNVFITNAAVVVDVTASCASLYVSNSIAITNLSINPGITLSVSNTITIPRPATGTATNYLNVGDGTLNAGAIRFTNSGTAVRHTILVGTGTLTVTNYIGQDVAGASPEIKFLGAGTLNVGGSYTNGSLVTFPGSTVNYFGSNQILYPFATNYYNLTLSGNGQKFPTNVLHVLQTLVITNTAVVAQSNNMFLGALKIADGAIFTNTINSLIVTNDTVIGDGTSGTFCLSAPAPATNWFGNLTIHAGALWTNAVTTGTNTFNFSGNFTNSGYFYAGNAICTNVSPGNYIVGAVSLSQLFVNGITTNIGTLTISSNLAGAGTLVQSTNAILNLGVSNAITFLNASLTTNTVNYTGANQLLRATNYWNLGLSGTGIKTMTNGTTMQNLSIASGTTAAITNVTPLTITISNLTLNGTLQVPNTWGGTGSGAVNINSTYFAPSTTGKLNVLRGAAASQLVFGTQPGTTTAGSSITPAVSVIFQDGSGNTAITNGSITISSANTTFTGGSTLTVAASAGVATFSALQPTTAGTLRTLSAGSGVLSVNSSTFTVNPTTATKLAFGVQPTTVTAGSAISPAVTVLVQDTYGNTASTNSSVTISSGNTAFTGSTLTVAAVNGTATFSVLQPTTAGSGKTLGAASTGITSATSATFLVNPAAINSYTVTAPTPQTAGVSFNTTVTALDAYANTVTTDSSTVVTMTSSGSAQFDSNGDNTYGDNTKTLFAGTFTINTKDFLAQTVTLTATSSGGKTGTSSGVVVNKATPAFSSLTGNQTIGYGDASVTLSGTLSAAGGLYPASGETVAITINNTTVNATIGSAGAFSATFATTQLPALASPGWTITYAYAGNSTSLNAATSDTSTHVIVNQGAVTVTASDATAPYGSGYTAVGSGRTEFIATGLHNGDTIGSVTITATNTPFNGTLATDPAGNYKLQPGAATGGTFNPANYLITYAPGTLIVDKANLTFNPIATLQIYDGTTLNNGTYSTTLANYTISGYQNGQTAGSINLTLTGSLAFNGSTATTVKNVATYTLGAGTLAVNSSIVSNYTLVFANPSSHTYIITNKAVTVSGLTANNKTADGGFTATLSGTATLTAEAVGSGTISDGKYYTGDTMGLSGTPVGTFAQSATGTGIAVSVSGLSIANGNYVLIQPTLSANITPAAIDHYVVTFSAAPSFAGVPFYTYATAKDAYGNTVTTDSSTVVSFSSSSSTMTWDGNGDNTFGNTGSEISVTNVSGVATIHSKDNTAELNVTVTAADTSKSGSASINVVSQTGAYRTQASGNWSDASIWQTFNGSTWVTASAAPDYNNGVITILPTHNVAVTASVSVDQLIVQAGGGLTVNGSQTLTVVTTSLPGLELYGAMTNHGTLQINSSPGNVVMAVYNTGLLVNDGNVTPTGSLQIDGTYQHAFTTTAGTIPAATWDAGSTCLIAGYTSNTAAPGGLNQSFQNFIWGCPNQTASATLGASFTTANTFSVTNTGTGKVVLGANLTATTSATVGSGAYLDCANQVISGSSFTLATGATLGIGSTTGITSSGSSGNIQTTARSFSTSATYVYDGTANQDVGSGLPAMVYALVDNNAGNVVTLDQSTAITTNLTIASSAQLGLPNGSSSTAYVLYINGNSLAAGSWGSSGSSATHKSNTYFVAATTGIINVTYGSPVTFTGLTGSQTIYYGTSPVTFSGTLAGAGAGETVTVAIDSGSATTTTTSGGAFSLAYDTSKIPHNNFTPHTITYSYAGSANLNLTNDTSTALTVQAVAASIRATDAQKTYGTTYTAVGAGQTGFTTAGFVNGETIATVTITATATPSGTAIRDEVGDYPLSVSAATGGTVDTNNYNITYQSGTLTVNPAPLTITANNLSKTYGTTKTFAGTEFSSTGLLSGDAITSVTLTSSGAASSATAASTYAIVPSAATGTGLSDYNITYVNGTLTVNKATPTVTLTSNTNPCGYLDPVTFSVSLPADATGEVNFSTNGVYLSTEALSSGAATSLGAPGLIRASTNVVAVAYGGDNNYTTASGSITQTVTNHPPTAPDLSANRTAGLRLYIARSVITNNWSDADGDTVTLTGINTTSANGVTLSVNNNYIYYPKPDGSQVNDTIYYTLTDSFGESTIGHINVVVQPYTSGQSAAVTPSGNSVSLKFYGILGYSYDVQRTTDFATWHTVAAGVSPGSDGTIHVTDTFTDLGGIAPGSASYRLNWHP
ncbi:MAG: MBG domain-containing protein [Verrucomicrobiota bacterium]